MEDEQLTAEFGDDWYERARWICACGDYFTLDDMYEWSGVCPYCGIEPAVDVDYLRNLGMPF